MSEGDCLSHAGSGGSAPRAVAGYQLLRKVGDGGMSAVYQSYDVVAARPVAVKLLADHLAGQPEFVGRFYREARLSRVLEHPSIVQGYASGFDSEASKHYLVLEFIDGPTAHGALTRLGRLSVGMAVRVGIDIARALEFLHDRQYVHRDVKPDNILLHPNGGAKLADLGLAKRLNDTSQLTAIHQGVGTTYYMPYEQAVNANLVDGRSDLFALGATLYHLLSGEVPFHGTTHDEVIREKAQGTFRPLRAAAPAVPAELAELIESLLACDPRARVQTAGKLAAALAATGLAGKLPSFADGHSRSISAPDPTPDTATRVDHPLPPAGDSFAASRNTPSAARAKLGGWPWMLGAGAVVLALTANQWARTRATPEPVPPAVVQETPDPTDGLSPALAQ